jgi:NAD(P)-dependent dehydrogenase (short-subunit alcohol dehydrogenase family)
MDRLFELVKRATGRVDIVFANAGYAAAAPLGNITEEHVDGLLNTNVKGVIWTVQKAVPLMGPGGSIILSSSIAGSKGFGNWSMYSATKAAVRSFARAWASDLNGRNIRVNAVSPGVIETPGKIFFIGGSHRPLIEGGLAAPELQTIAAKSGSLGVLSSINQEP